MSFKAADKPLMIMAAKALLPVTLSTNWRNNPALLMLVRDGFIHPGQLVENGLIKKSKGNLKSLISLYRSEDYNDFSDAKYLSATSLGQDRYGTKFASQALHNKKGALRIVVYEKKQNKLYYFYVPRRAWKDNICGPNFQFHQNGDPKDTNKWWAYEVDSFVELARIKKEDWINIR